MTSCFSTQLDTLSSALCFDIENDSSEADPCSSRKWKQIDNVKGPFTQRATERTMQQCD